MKYSVKLLLREDKPNEQGLYPIWLRIIINLKPAYISTAHYVPKALWDERTQTVKPGHLQADIINADITSRKTAAMNKIVEAKMKSLPLTAAQVKDFFTRKVDLHNIFDFVEQFSGEVQHKREDSTRENYRKHALKLEQFHGSKNLTFEEITPEYLARFETELRKTVGENYTASIWSTLRTFFNAAKKRRIITCYPFDEYENPVYTPPNKAYLTLTELQRWEAYADQAKDNTHRQTATWFLLGCYSGLRISDWVRFDPEKHVEGDRITLYAKKNGELVTMPISTPLERTIARIRELPLTLEEPMINRTLKLIAKDPDVHINKLITTHVGRHTFAITLCAEMGIGVETCAELMGITVKTCAENYYRVTKTKIMNETRAAWKGLR